MKRFIITNLLAVITLPMLACFGGWTTNYYLFSVYEGTDFSNRIDEITLKNWKTSTNTSTAPVSRGASCTSGTTQRKKTSQPKDETFRPSAPMPKVS